MNSRGYLNARAAAEYLGYQPKTDSPRDPQMKAFYAFAAKHLDAAKVWIGRRLMFDPAVIESKLRRASNVIEDSPIDTSLSEAQQLAIAHARGYALDMRARRRL